MIGLKKRDMKTILKAGAKARGLSLSEFRAEIQENIDNAVNSQDPAVQERFKKYFGNRIPTPEEYIYTITKKTKFEMVILLLAEQSSRIADERTKKTRSLFAFRPLVFHDTVNRSLNDFEFFICQFIKRYVYLSADCRFFRFLLRIEIFVNRDMEHGH